MRSGSTSAAPQTILPTAGSTAIAAPFDPITGPGACATTSATDQADTATYRMDPVPTGGFTLLGSPTVVADITSPGSNSQIAARLLDVDTGTNTQTLVARGLWRPAITVGPRAAGVPAAPERLPVRRRPRGEARAAAEGLEHRGRQQLRPHVEQPAERHHREPRAAAADARGGGRAGRTRPGSGAQGPAVGLHARGRTSRRCSIRGPKGATPLRASLVAGVRGMHRAEPHARPAVRVPVVQPAAADVATTSPWGRRTPTAQRPSRPAWRATTRCSATRRRRPTRPTWP